MARLRLGVLVSGRGSNLEAIIAAITGGELDAEAVLVVSNHPCAPAVSKAERYGVPTIILQHDVFPSRLEHQSAIADALERANVQLVVLAGFDRVLCPEFVARFPHRIINVHPSLLPAFAGGLHAQAAAVEHGVKVSGCTVHLVTSEVDAGPIIVQRAVPVYDDDTAESLASRILAEEHRALPEAIRLFAAGRLAIDGRRVRVIDG